MLQLWSLDLRLWYFRPEIRVIVITLATIAEV